MTSICSFFESTGTRSNSYLNPSLPEIAAAFLKASVSRRLRVGDSVALSGIVARLRVERTSANICIGPERLGAPTEDRRD
jgi:hypothetical protein